jgi:hypothetical protein
MENNLTKRAISTIANSRQLKEAWTGASEKGRSAILLAFYHGYSLASNGEEEGGKQLMTEREFLNEALPDVNKAVAA